MNKWTSASGREFPIKKWTVYKDVMWLAAAPLNEGSPFTSFGEDTRAFFDHAEALAYAVKQSGQ